MVACGLEDREEQRLRCTGRNLGKCGHHVGVLPVDAGEPGDGAAEGLVGVCERLGETLGVGVAVVDCGCVGQAELLVDELSHGGALVEVVVSGAVVAQVVALARGAGQVGGQRGCRVGRRDHHHSRTGNEWGSGFGRSRTGTCR